MLVNGENNNTAHCSPTGKFPSDWIQEDHYNGVTIHLPDAVDTTSFSQMLTRSLEAWQQQGRKGIWLYLSQAHVDKVAAAVAVGFNFHQVSSSGGSDSTKTLILSKWLPTNVPNRLPAGPSHQVGVGCLVFHPTNTQQMLVVKETTGPAAAANLWKMPTGLTDWAEDIHAAAIRELYEETGLVAEFVELLQFRQAHASRGGRSVSDLFFVCRLQLVSSHNDQELRPCPEEIAAVQWMSVQDYCNQERWQQSPVYQELNRIILEASLGAPTVRGLQSHTLDLGFGRGTNTLYHGASHGSHQSNSAQSQL